MKRRRIILIAGAALLCGVVWFFLPSRQPAYDGKPLAQWLDECTAMAITNRSDYNFFMSSLPRDVRHFGPSAVPSLTRMVEAKHPLKRWFYEFVRARKSQSQWKRSVLDKWNIESRRPETAAFFLGCIGPDAESAIPALMNAVGGTNDVLSRNAINALGSIHRRQDIVAPFLARIATNSNPSLSIYAVSALGTFNEQPGVAVPALICAISNDMSDVYVVIGASRLAHYGSNALPAVPLLREIAASQIRTVNTRWNAAWALDQIASEPNTDVILPVYVKCIETQDNFAYTAILQLYSWGPRARAAVPALLNYISKKPYEASSAAYALKAIDPEAAAKIWDSESLRPAIKLIGADQAVAEPESREQFIARIRALNDRALPELITILKGTNKSYSASIERGHAAYMLGEMGAAAKDAIPVLASLTNSVTGATAALMKIRGESPLPLISRLDDTSDWQEWSACASILAGFGPLAEPAIPKVIAVFNHRPQYFHTYLDPAVRLLGAIHRQPDVCVPLLASFLEYPGASTRRESIEALGKFGNDARPALPALLESLKDLDVSARTSATNALKQIDPEAAAKAGVK